LHHHHHPKLREFLEILGIHSPFWNLACSAKGSYSFVTSRILIELKMDPARTIPTETFEEPEQGSKLARKMRESPFMVAGLAGLVGIVGYNIWGLRTKPKDMKLSVYLIHMRVGAQGFVVSALTLGVCYQMYTEHLQPKIEKWRAANISNK